MANPELTVGFQLAAQQQYARLRFVVTPINPANPVTINWPQFSLEHTHPMLYCIKVQGNHPKYLNR